MGAWGVPMGAFGAPWVVGAALGAGLVCSLPAGNVMTSSGGFVAIGGATPTIMSPTPTLDRLDRSGCMQRMAVGGRGDAFRPFWGRFGLRVVC